MSRDIRIEVYKIMVFMLYRTKQFRAFTDYIEVRDNAITLDDIVQEVYVKFLEWKYDERFDEEMSLISYVKQFLLWTLMAWCRLLNGKPRPFSLDEPVFEHKGQERDLEEVLGDETTSFSRLTLLKDQVEGNPEKLFLIKEAEKILKDLFPDEGIREVALGKISQSDLARERGVSRQAIHQKLHKQRKLAQEQWRRDEEG